MLLTIVLTCCFLALLVYMIFHNIAYKNFFKKSQQYLRQRYGFYECGFRPRQELSIEFSMQNYVMFAMTILYDVEAVLLLFFLQNLNIFATVDMLLIVLYLVFFILGIFFDIKQRSIFWQYY